MNDIADYHYEIYNNRNQGNAPRVLFVCSGGILRSATAAHWAAEHKGWNTRSAGIFNTSVPPVSGVLIKWAELIYCMEQKHQDALWTAYGEGVLQKISILNILDIYRYRDPELIRLIAAALGEGA